MRRLFCLFILIPFLGSAQLSWQSTDSIFAPLPNGVHVFFTENRIDTAPFRAYYLVVDLHNRKLEFTTDTTSKRRLTPRQFFEKNHSPLLVVNGTFFSFETNQNLNLVMRNKKAVAFNAPNRGREKDSVHQYPAYRSAIGISKRRMADVAWTATDSSKKVMALQSPYDGQAISKEDKESPKPKFQKWKMQTAIGGGPVLLQNGEIKISNDIERKFGGKAINDKHPRTAMGYTADGKLIILVIEGRNPNAGGATLTQEAQLLKDLGCIEAINLDGGGSSCMLVNGKETIRPSDKIQRAVPAVFIIRKKD